jgi:hypothetical protein
MVGAASNSVVCLGTKAGFDCGANPVTVDAKRNKTTVDNLAIILFYDDLKEVEPTVLTRLFYPTADHRPQQLLTLFQHEPRHPTSLARSYSLIFEVRFNVAASTWYENFSQACRERR